MAACGAVEAGDGDRIEAQLAQILTIRFPGVTTVTPDPGVATRASLRSVCLWVPPQSHEVLNEGEDPRQDKRHISLLGIVVGSGRSAILKENDEVYS